MICWNRKRDFPEVGHALLLSTLWNLITAERAVLLELRERGDCCASAAGQATGEADCRTSDRGRLHWGGPGEWMGCHDGPHSDRGGMPVYERTGGRRLPCRLDRNSGKADCDAGDGPAERSGKLSTGELSPQT